MLLVQLKKSKACCAHARYGLRIGDAGFLSDIYKRFLCLPFFHVFNVLAHIPLHCHPEYWWGHSHWCPHQPKYRRGYVPGIPGGVVAYASCAWTSWSGHLTQFRNFGTPL